MGLLGLTGTRGGISWSPTAAELDAYLVKRSVRFNDDDSAYLNWTPSLGNRQKWTYSCWVKRSGLTGDQTSLLFAKNYNSNSNWLQFGFYGDELQLIGYSKWFFKATPSFRDPSAWMHVVLSIDTTISAPNEDNRMRLYVNGSEVTFSTRNNPSLSANFAINHSSLHQIGQVVSSYQFDGYIADIHMVEGLQLTPGDFAEPDATTGQWIPKKFTGTYGTNGFHLAMDPDETGTTYSSRANWTGTSDDGTLTNASSYPLSAAFDGSLSTTFAMSYAGGMIWTAPTTISFSTSIEVYVDSSIGAGPQGYITTISGTPQSKVDVNADGSWQSIYSGSGTFDKLEITRNTGGNNNNLWISGIRVDGKIIVDHTTIGYDSSGNENHWHENNLVAASNAVTVAAATDGLPFYNTTGDYGGTKDTGYRTDSSAGTTDGTGLVLALPGDVLTDEHDHVNTGSSAHTITVNGTVTSTSGSKFYGTSLEFDGSNDYLVTPVSTDFEFGSGDFTLECWIKPDADDNGPSPVTMGNGSGSYSSILLYSHNVSNGFGCYLSSNGSSWNMSTYKGTGGYTVGEWMHYALTRDGNTFRLFSNGMLKETWTASGSLYGNTNQLSIGGPRDSDYFNGNIQDLRVYKGVAKYTSDFTVPTRQTNATDIDLLDDIPGAPYDNSLNGGGNYCTWNSLQKGNGILSNGNLEYIGDGSWEQTHGTIGGLTSGKWYYEMTLMNDPHSQGYNAEYQIFGWTSNPISTTNNQSTDWLGFEDTGWYRNFGSHTDSSTTLVGGDVLSISVDLDANTFNFRCNNSSVLSGTIGGTAGRVLYPFHMSYNASKSKMVANFGARSFEYTPPTGYKALNTYNLTAPTITDPSEHFDVKTYDGTGSTKVFTGFEFGPDLAWFKKRSGSANHYVYDSVRGQGKHLYADRDTDESTSTTGLTAFSTDGYTIQTVNDMNDSGQTYVSWNWNAGTTTDTNNNAGSIIPTGVRANTTAGFSIVSYIGGGTSGDSIGHGLNAPPSFVLIKNRDQDEAWLAMHTGAGLSGDNIVNTSVPEYEMLLLNEAQQRYNWTNDVVAPNGSDKLTLGDGNMVNTSTENYIAYCWSEVPGYSKFGLFEGNNSTDGPFIALGFRPAMILFKNIDANNTAWAIYDNKRDTFNEATKVLSPNNNGGGNANDAWITSYPVDFLSNGFKIRNTAGEVNGNYTYIYAAFAETPTKYSNAR